MQYNISLIPGDGIGPEVAKPALKIIKAAGVAVDWATCLKALQTVLLKGERLTPDLKGSATTTQFGDAVIREIES